MNYQQCRGLHITSRLTVILFMAITFLNAANSTYAGTYNWVGGLDNRWDSTVYIPPIIELSNWDGSSTDYPNSTNDTAVFGAYPAPTTVNLNGNKFIRSVNFVGSHSFNLTNGTLGLASGITLNTAAPQTINANVALLADNIWDVPGSSLTVNGNIVNNFELTKTGGGTLYIRNGNSNYNSTFVKGGTLVIEQNASVHNSQPTLVGEDENTTVFATVDNATWNNALDLHVGVYGNGTLNILNGATVSSARSSIGFWVTSTGAINVNNATWNISDELVVGTAGNATLNIQNGATVSSIKSLIGAHKTSNANVTVTDPGSTWNTTGELTIGWLGNTTLNIQNGATVSNTNGYIGNISNSNSTVTVTGNNATWNNSGTLYVGLDGKGTLNIQNGGNVTVDGAVNIGNDDNLYLNGGTLTAGSLNTNNPLRFHFNSGKLHLTNQPITIGVNQFFGNELLIPSTHTIDISKTTTINPGANLIVSGQFNPLGGLTNRGNLILIDNTGNGKTINGPINSPAGSEITLVGDATFTGPVSGAGNFFGSGTATFQGGYSPGDSPATVTFESDLALTSTNTLTIELAGTTAGINFDQLIIGGGASLGGNLLIDLVNGYIPEPGTTFEIFNFDSILGSFTDIITNNVPDGLYFDINIDELLGIATLIAQAHFPGDATLDGVVNLADLAKLATNFGTPANATWFQGDFTNDGVINLADLAKLATNFGQTLDAPILSAPVLSSNGVAVPEPTSFLGLLLLGSGMLRRKRI